MALYRYFQPVDSLPDPRGQLSRKINPATIQDANKAVRDAPKKSKSRGKYSKFTPEQQANIAGYAVMYGIVAAVRRFSGESDAELKESTIRNWRQKYLAEVDLKKRNGEADTPVTSLTVKKRGRPLLLGEKLDEDVKHYISHSYCTKSR